MLTTWGDCGNHQPWSTMYPPLFLGSQLTWSLKDVTDEKIGTFIDRTVFHAPALGLGQALIDLAKLDQIIGFKLPNNSLPWFALFSAQPEKLPEHLAEQLSVHQLQDGLDWLNKINSGSFSSENNSKCAARRAGVEAWDRSFDQGINHAIRMMSKDIILPTSQRNPSPLIERFQDIWLQPLPERRITRGCFPARKRTIKIAIYDSCPCSGGTSAANWRPHESCPRLLNI